MRPTPQPIAAYPRPLSGKRWLDIALRSLHLVGLLGVGGGMVYDVAMSEVLPWLWLTALTGLAMVSLSLWSNRRWLRQLRGIAILVKLVILALIPLFPEQGVGLLIGVTLLSGVVAHAPGSVRYYSPRHRRGVDDD